MLLSLYSGTVSGLLLGVCGAGTDEARRAEKFCGKADQCSGDFSAGTLQRGPEALYSAAGRDSAALQSQHLHAIAALHRETGEMPKTAEAPSSGRCGVVSSAGGSAGVFADGQGHAGLDHWRGTAGVLLRSGGKDHFHSTVPDHCDQYRNDAPACQCIQCPAAGAAAKAAAGGGAIWNSHGDAHDDGDTCGGTADDPVVSGRRI